MYNRDDDRYDDADSGDDGLSADPAYGRRPYGEEAPRRRGVTSMAVVVLGLAAFGGIIAYAYNQGMRAGTEAVAPVLRADPSPTKVRPEQPGGMQVPHQDKLVYDRLNPSSTEPGVERLLPPPEQPVERPRAEAVQPAEEDVTSGIPEGDLPVEEPAADTAPVQMAEPVPEAAAPPRGEPAPAASAPKVDVEAPPPAPPPVAKVETPPAAAPPKPAEPAATAAKPPAKGNARVQVAAVDSEAKAKAEWARLQKRYPAELGGLGLTVVKADLGAKGIFYRLQGGPVDDERAAKICSALKAQNVGCIVVR